MSSVRRLCAAVVASWATTGILCGILLSADLAVAEEQPAPPAAQGNVVAPAPAPEQAQAQPAAPQANDAKDAQPADALFSTAYQACMDDAAGVSTAMQDCMATEQERLDKRLGGQRERIAAQLPPERAKAFNDALNAWDSLRKNGSTAMYDPDGGTLSPLMATLWYLDQTARMVRWVDNLQENAEP